MHPGLLQTVKFKIIFAICWFSITEVQAIVLTRFGFSWRIALLDSGISNLLLAGACLVIAKTFQYYNPQKNKYLFIIGLIVTLSVGWLFLSRGIIMPLAGNEADYVRYFSISFVLRLCFGLLITGCMALISVLWYTIKDQQETDRRKQEAETLARDAELYRLRQQLQPHFLFNSLNSINALIVSKPTEARTMVLQLSDFLRGTLKKDDDQWVSLASELQHLQLYLDIEKVRFGHRLLTIVENNTATDMTMLPAMLLQPIVENAIKFGLYDTLESVTITITASSNKAELTITVTNPYDAETSQPLAGTGFGLSSVKRRLFLLFARHHLLQTSFNNNIFTTTISIPQLP